MIIYVSLLMILIMLRIKILMKTIMMIVIIKSHIINKKNSDILNS